MVGIESWFSHTMLSPEEIVTHKPTVVCVNPVNNIFGMNNVSLILIILFPVVDTSGTVLSTDLTS